VSYFCSSQKNSGDGINKGEMGGACGMCVGRERCIEVLVGKCEGKRLLGRPGYKR